MARRSTESGFRFAAGSSPPARWPWLERRRVVPLLLALALGGAVVYLYLHPASAPGWLRSTGLLPPPAPTVVYRWRDPRGEWHITDQPPAPGLSYERLEYRHDANVVPVPPGAADQR